MIEDPDLTRRILEYFANDAIDFPANVQVEQHLSAEFPEIGVSSLQYHVVCAIENGLLRGDVERTSMLEGVIVTIGYIDGLSAKGGNYVRNSRTTFWRQAWEKIESTGLEVTTERLVVALAKMTSNAVDKVIN